MRTRLLLPLLAVIFSFSCSRKPKPCSKAWIYFKGQKISLCDNFKKLDKRYDLSGDYTVDKGGDVRHYYNVIDGYSVKAERFYETCTLWVDYDMKAKRLIGVSIEYVYHNEVRKQELIDLAKEVYFDKFKKKTASFSQTIDDVRYEMKVDNDNGPYSSVNYSITQL